MFKKVLSYRIKFLDNTVEDLLWTPGLPALILWVFFGWNLLQVLGLIVGYVLAKALYVHIRDRISAWRKKRKQSDNVEHES